MCNVEATDQGSLVEHFAGKKHIKKVPARLFTDSHGDNLKLHDEKVYESKKPDSSGNGNFCCDICNVELTSQIQLDIHRAGKKHNKKAVQEAAQQRLALDKGQKIDNESQKVNENKLDLDKENVDQLNQKGIKSFKCIFCGETVGKDNWQTHIDTNHADKISQEKAGNLTAFPSISQLNGTKANISNVPSKCALCNKIISCEENMKSHLEKVHGSKKPVDKEINRPEENMKMSSNEMIGHEDNLRSQTGKSRSEALILGSTNPQYYKRLFIDLPPQYMKTTSSKNRENMLCA